MRPVWSSCSQTSGGLFTRVRLAVFMVRAFGRCGGPPAGLPKWEIPPETQPSAASVGGRRSLMRGGADLIERQLSLLAECGQVEVDRLSLHQSVTEGRDVREWDREGLARR